MNFPLRNQTPRRRNRKECKHYYSYKKDLREDFNCRCGYCASFDKVRCRSFTIDHFVPRKPDGWNHDIPPNFYHNLVYSCAYCNAAKKNKWPSRDAKIFNDGKKGFIDPVDPLYDKSFHRNGDGCIIVTDLSAELPSYISNELNLGNIVHSILWKLERIDLAINVIQENLPTAKDGEINAALNQLLLEYHALTSQLFKNDYE